MFYKALLILGITATSSASAALYPQVDTKLYQDYLDKLSSQNYLQSTNLYEIDRSIVLDKWLEELENLLEKQVPKNFKSRLALTISKKGYIEKIDILDIYENDFEVFKKLSAQLVAAKLREPPKSILQQDSDQMIKLVLDTNLMYIEKPAINYISDEDDFKLNNLTKTKTPKEIIEELKKQNLLEAKLISPEYLGYGKIGEVLKLTTLGKEPIELTANISAANRKELIIEVFQIKYGSKIIPSQLGYKIKNNDKRNFTAELINSGLNIAMQGGVINAISSYGIVPASLAIIGASGKAMQLNENFASINLSKGEIIKMEEMKK